MTKLALKCGDIEIDYDGPEEFLIKELPSLLEKVATLRMTGDLKASGEEKRVVSPSPTSPASVSTIAQRLAVGKGSELVLAAALSLTNSGQATFTKKQLREQMRDAKAYYKSSYANNFDNYVARLVTAGRLNHVTGDKYALPDKEQKKLAEKMSGT